jgi:hypothetical protein
MDSATISALAALAGATIGGVTSFATSWLSQQTQARVQQRAHKLSQREDLYKDFIEEAAKAYGDSLARRISDISEVTQLVSLYALVSRMRVMSSTATYESADKVVRTIVNSYLSPIKTLPELHDMVNSGSIDMLCEFSVACRDEFHKFERL